MNSVLDVARTYWWRPRFWIFGALYLLMIFWARGDAARSPLARFELLSVFLMLSNLFACVLVCLLALHVRRQFGNSQARLAPGYATPHWLVAIAFVLLIWWAVPTAEAGRLKFNPIMMIAAHTLVPLFLAGVIFWPKAIILLAAVPLMLVSLSQLADKHPEVKQFFEQFASGETGWTYALLIGLGLGMLPLAAWALTRVSDTAQAASDDFTIDAPGSGAGKNVLTEFLQRFRDVEIEARLARRSWWTALGQRGIPSTISWLEMGLFAAIILALMPFVWWLTINPGSAWIVMTGGSGLMLFAPFGFWRFRCNALATEYMWPATRRSVIRQIVGAMAADFAAWATVASVVITVGYLMLASRDGFWSPTNRLTMFPDATFFFTAIAYHVVVLWAMASLLFGLGLATLRFRFWMPLFVGCLICSVTAGIFSLNLVSESFRLLAVTDYRLYQLLLAGSYVGTVTLIALALGWLSYRRWLEMDLT